MMYDLTQGLAIQRAIPQLSKIKITWYMDNFYLDARYLMLSEHNIFF